MVRTQYVPSQIIGQVSHLDFAASAVPLRPIIAVYHHVRRSHHPMKQQGPWKSYEDDALKQYVFLFYLSLIISPLINVQSGCGPWPTVGEG